MVEAARIRNLPPYLFARIERLIEEKKQAGVDVISLGIGDPDQPTPAHVIEVLVKEAHNPANHQYPSSAGLLAYRQAVADWYRDRFGVELDPRTEVVSLIGSKEGIAHIAWCLLDPGDLALVPDPGYPVYAGGSVLAGAEVYPVPLLARNRFLPDLAAIPTEVARRAKVLYLNYPNNPTGAVAPEGFYREVVAFAREFDLVVLHDAAYSEITFDGYRHPSFLQVPGAREVGIEFHSVSKTYNMTGWRAGWAAGNAAVIDALARLKSNIDSGLFQAIQYAAIAALRGPQDGVAILRQLYQERRDLALAALRDMGWDIAPPGGTFYVWAPVPEGYTSESFAEEVLERAAVVVTPGNGYGRYGEGYFRISLTLPTERLAEALGRMKRALGRVTVPAF
jgi:LL-diaminopimelate aminotransferase